MTQEQIDHYRKAADEGTIPDEKNPLYLLQSVHTDLLVKIIQHDFNVAELAKHELSQRGLNREGKWVGFKAAEQVHAAPRKKPAPVRKKGRGL